jgi:SAM-dependent methyltransferase
MGSYSCIICGQSNSTVVFHEFGVDVLRCQQCGHVFSAYEADEHYDGYFGEDVSAGDHFWWNEAHARTHSDFCDRFLAGKAGNLLDVGCGLGFFLKRASSYPEWHVSGCDTSRAAVKFAQRELALEDVRCGPVENCGFEEKHFDMVTLWDVLEHVPEPDPLLSFLRTLLEGNGILFIHTPNVQIQLPKAKVTRLLRGMKPNLHYLEARDHINLYSMDTMRRVLARNGYRDIDFVHLPPIQSLAGSRNRVLTVGKNTAFQLSKALFHVSRGRLNLDNLFVAARR